MTLEVTAPANGASSSLSPLLDVRLTAYTDPFDCCTITVSLGNDFGQVGSDDVDVTVVERPDDGPPALSITSPSLLESFRTGQRAHVAYSVIDPSPPPPTSVEWSISYGLAGNRLPITLVTDPRPLPTRPSNQYFRPSNDVMPLCFHSTNPSLETYVVRLTYTNADGRSATARVPIFLNADPNLCIS